MPHASLCYPSRTAKQQKCTSARQDSVQSHPCPLMLSSGQWREPKELQGKHGKNRWRQENTLFLVGQEVKGGKLQLAKSAIRCKSSRCSRHQINFLELHCLGCFMSKVFALRFLSLVVLNTLSPSVQLFAVNHSSFLELYNTFWRKWKELVKNIFLHQTPRIWNHNH